MIIDGEGEEELDLGEVELEGDEEEFDPGSEEDLEEEEPSEEETEEPSEEEEQQLSRGQKRFRKLVAARKNVEAENIKLRQELDRTRAQQTQVNNPANDPRAVQAWLNSLPPEQRTQAELRIQLNQHTQQLALVQFNVQDSADRSAYDAKAVTNAVYRKYASEVETKLQELRRDQNLNASREDILMYIIGGMVLKNNKSKPTTKKKAEKSIKKNTVSPSNGRSNIQPKNRQGSTPRERLEGVKF